MNNHVKLANSELTQSRQESRDSLEDLVRLPHVTLGYHV